MWQALLARARLIRTRAPAAARASSAASARGRSTTSRRLPPQRLRLLGLVLAAGLPLRAAALSAQLLFAYAFDILLSWSRGERLRARVRAVSHRLQHQPVPVVQGRVVLVPVPAHRRRLPGQGVRALGPRRPARPHLQPVGLHAGAVLARAARHRHDAMTWGAGDRHHLRPRAADLPGAVPRSASVVMYFFSITPVTAAAAATLFGAQRALQRRDRRALLRRLRDSVGGVPRAAPAGHRSVDLAAHAARARDLRRALRRGRRSRSTRCSAPSALPTFYDKLLCVPLLNLRCRRSIALVPRARRAAARRPRWGSTRRSGARNLAHMAAWIAFFARDDRRRARPTACTRATRCRSGSRRAPTAARRPASGCCASRRRTAATTPAGPATSSGATTWRAGSCRRDLDRAFAYFSRACEGRFQAGLRQPARPAVRRPGPIPRALDLRLLVREGGPNLSTCPSRNCTRAPAATAGASRARRRRASR